MVFGNSGASQANDLTMSHSSVTLEQLRTHLIQLAPELRDMAESLPQNNPDYGRVAATPVRLINFLCRGLSDIDKICNGYIRFCETFKAKQWEFVRSQHYAECNYRHVNELVYQNTSYMLDVYYPALLLSYLFSSNYFAIYRTFCDLFIPMCLNKSGATMEVGIGHGLLSASLLHANHNLVGYGLDISPVASQVSSRVSAFFELRHPISILAGDATESIPAGTEDSYGIMICAEVLEHLTEPARLLRNMHAALNDEGILFVTASINMESVDHLFLFRSDEEVLKIVEQCGFEIIKQDLAFLTVQPYRDNPRLVARLKECQNPATAILIASKKRRALRA